MKKINLLIIFGFLAFTADVLNADHCPFDWNIRLNKRLEFTNSTIPEIITKLNAVVSKQTNGKIAKVAIWDPSPTTIIKITDDKWIVEKMDALIKKYREYVTPIYVKKEKQTPSVVFRKNMPLAFYLKGLGYGSHISYKETEKGAVFSRRPIWLECRIYRIADALLKRVKEYKKTRKEPGGGHWKFSRLRMARGQKGRSRVIGQKSFVTGSAFGRH